MTSVDGKGLGLRQQGSGRRPQGMTGGSGEGRLDRPERCWKFRLWEP